MERELLTAGAVARRLACGWRSVYRWTDAGRMPRPVKVAGGRLTRWRAVDIEAWIEAGCPDLRKGGRS